MRFFELLKNDLLGREGKNKEIATKFEREQYNFILAAAFAIAGLVLAAIGGWAWVGALICGGVAARKLQIVLNKRDVL